MNLLSLILAFVLSGMTPLPQESGSEISFSLYFRWDKSEHDEDYVSNKGALDRFINQVRQIDKATINSIDVTSYSSPEGVYEHNMKLSRERARYVRTLLRTNIPELSSRIHVRSGGEAWGPLRDRVAADRKLTDHSRERVLKFLDNDEISNDTRKWRLANWLGNDPNVGSIYKYLLRAHYRYLRCCVVVVITLKEPALAGMNATAPAPASQQDAPAPARPAADSATAERDSDMNAANAALRAPTDSVAAPAGTAVAPADTVAKAPADSTAAVVPSSDEAANLADATAARRRFTPVLGLSTNLPYDITYFPGYGLTSIPSFSIEYYPSNWGHYTFGADVEWPMWKHWDTHNFMQINNLTFWGRRYFKAADEQRYKGLYLLASVNAARFGVGSDGTGWQGEGAGISAGIGHKWMLGRSRFFVDAGLAVGGFFAAYDSYTYGNDAFGWYYYDYTGKVEDFKPRSKRWLWFGPTRVYISIGIDLFNRDRKK